MNKPPYFAEQHPNVLTVSAGCEGHSSNCLSEGIYALCVQQRKGDKIERTAFLKCQTVGVLLKYLPSPSLSWSIKLPLTMLHVVTMTFGHPSFFPSPGSLLNRNITMRFNTGSIATLQWYIHSHNEYWWMKTNTCMGNLYSGQCVCNSRADDVSLRFFRHVCFLPSAHTIK